ncbi:MAG: hypothetical protein R3279_08710 [Putridiphycobacter sp.]|nr:hypothetical protein [Putridiphycobacter sp.]
MNKILLLFSLWSSILHGQSDNRFQVGFSFHSTVFLGLRSFNNVSRMVYSQDHQYYQYEAYDINYINFGSSAGFNLQLGINWLNNTKYIIRQNFACFADFFREQIEYTLVDFVVGDPLFYPNLWLTNESFGIGTVQTAKMDGFGLGLSSEVIVLKPLQNQWNVGGGISINRLHRSDASYHFTENFYGPNNARLVSGVYISKQLGIVIHAEKRFKTWNAFLTVNQMLFTMKKNKHKGAAYFLEDKTIYPLSHNLDYRFPVLINVGGAFFL